MLLTVDELIQCILIKNFYAIHNAWLFYMFPASNDKRKSALCHSRPSSKLCCRPATYLFLSAFCKYIRNQKILILGRVSIFFPSLSFFGLFLFSSSTSILAEVHGKFLCPMFTNRLQRFLVISSKIIRIFVSELILCYIICLNKIKYSSPASTPLPSFSIT